MDEQDAYEDDFELIQTVYVDEDALYTDIDEDYEFEYVSAESHE